MDGKYVSNLGQCIFVDLAGTETNQQTGFNLKAKRQALFINESLQHLAKVILKVTNHSEPKTIPFKNDPLTLIIKDTLLGKPVTTITN